MSLILVSSPHTDVLEPAFCIAAHLSYALPDTSWAPWLRSLGSHEDSGLSKGISLGLGVTATAKTAHSQHRPDPSSGSARWAQAQRTNVWWQQETLAAFPGCLPGGPRFWQRRPWHQSLPNSQGGVGQPVAAVQSKFGWGSEAD